MTTLQKTLRPLFLFSLLMAGLWLFPALSHAHTIRVFAWVAGDTVTVESGFSGGRPLIQGTVEVQNAENGTPLLQGKTNEEGIFTFSLTKTGQGKNIPLRIIVSSDEGHRNEWLLAAEADHAATEQNTTDPAATTPPPEILLSKKNSDEQLTRILAQLLDEKLKPIQRSLAQAEEQKPTLTDILGALGYLIGLAGIIAWMKSRR
jgi:nickel transport protein